MQAIAPALKLTRVRWLPVLALGLLLAPDLGAQELPIRTWNVRDGLIQSRVNSIRRDTYGFVWFATWEGASRFDGRRFLNYGSREGLPNPLVWCVAEGPDKTIWLGTHGGGIARVAETGCALGVDPSGPRNPARRVFEIVFDRDGRMWLVTEQGLFVSADSRPDKLCFEHVDELGSTWFGRSFVDERSQLSFVSTDEIVRCRGRTIERTAFAHEDMGDLRAVKPRRAGGCWVAHVRSLHVIDLPADDGQKPLLQAYPVGLVPNASIYDLDEDESGRLWVATSRGLACVEGDKVRWFTAAHGLPDDWINVLSHDAEGGLWIGTHQGGAAYLPDSGVEHYTRRSGLGDGHATKICALDGDRWIVSTEVAGLFELAEGRARLIAGTDRPPFDRIQHNLVRDGSGDWWIGTDAGIFRARGSGLDLSKAELLGVAHGVPGTAKFVLGLDPGGRVLVSTDEGHVFAKASGSELFEELPFSLPGSIVRYVASKPDGPIWLSDGTRLYRWRDGRLSQFDPWPNSNDEPAPRVMSFDARGWLWIGTRFNGIAFTRDPDTEKPRFELLTTRDGLASDTVFAIAPHAGGALYFGTGRGVQRYAPLDGAFEPIGVDDGIAGEWITDLAFDARGDLWVSATNGVSRVHASTPRIWRVPPRVRFTRCTVAGADVVWPAAGTLEPVKLAMEAHDSRLAFEYVAVDSVHGERLLYQTRLDGLDGDWSTATRELSARYGRLAAGTYHFAVRCIDPNTSTPGEPSTIEIDVVPPLCARTWVMALALLMVAGLGYAAHRLRLARELALERVRTQIASDLHDDIGAGLAQIAISGELARRAPTPDARVLMGEIADVARNLRASMSDLVWAVDPRHDTLADVVGRMRQFAGDMIAGAGQDLVFHSPDEGDLARCVVSPGDRRNLYLLFKEAVTNITRHARAAHVEIDLALEGRRLLLSIRDDGCGFDARSQHQGHGLVNLRRRAHDLGASLSIDSAAGGGTRIVLEKAL